MATNSSLPDTTQSDFEKIVTSCGALLGSQTPFLEVRQKTDGTLYLYEDYWGTDNLGNTRLIRENKIPLEMDTSAMPSNPYTAYRAGDYKILIIWTSPEVPKCGPYNAEVQLGSRSPLRCSNGCDG
jgi:hypothetical protein